MDSRKFGAPARLAVQERLAQGMTPAQIAADLNVSRQRIYDLMRQIREKAGARKSA